MWLSGRVHAVLDLRLSQIITRTSSMRMRQVLDCVVFSGLSSVLDQIRQYQIKIILNNAGIKSAVKEKWSWIVWLSVLKKCGWIFLL